jgi:hypothetical protein
VGTIRGNTAHRRQLRWSTMDSSELERIEDLWFEDGTLVLQAESSLFRIYKSILSIKSSVLRAIFSQPHNDTLDDCPLVILDDSAQDLTYFLKAIYNPEYVLSSLITHPSHSPLCSFFEKATETEYPILAGVLRLSTKYNVKTFRQLSLTHLTSLYPTTLEAWEQRDSTRTIVGEDPSPFAVLQLARDTNVQGILPAVMYSLITYPVEDIFDGTTWNETYYNASDADRRTCLLARQTLITAKRRSVAAFLRGSTDVSACITHDVCNSGRLTAIFTNEDGVEGCDPLWDHFDWGEYASNVCPACLSASKTSYKSARMTMWADLPAIFNLPTWVKLKASIR